MGRMMASKETAPASPAGVSRRWVLLLDRTPLWAAVTAGLILVLRLLPSLQRQLYNIDEGLTLGVGYFVAKGGLPYVDGICQRGPLLHLTAAAVFRLFGDFNIVAWNLAGFFFFSATAIFVWLAARELFGKRVANLAAPLFVLVHSLVLHTNDALGLNGELFGNLPAVAAVFVLVKSKKSGGAAGYFASGLLVMIAALFKQVLAIQSLLIAEVAVMAFLAERDEKRAFGRFLLRGGAALAGFAIPMAVVVWIYARAGHLPDFRFWFFEYNARYASEGFARLNLANMAFWFLGMVFLRLSLPTVGVVLGARHVFSKATLGEKAPSIIGFTWVLITLGSVLLGVRPFGYYFVQALPALCVFGAFGLIHPGPARAARRAWPRNVAAGAATLAVALMFLFMIVNLRTGLVRIYHGIAPGMEKAWKSSNPRAAVAEWIRKTTAPDDTVFVWGFRPRIYPLAGRAPATRFVSANYLAGQFGGFLIDPDAEDLARYIIPGQWKVALRELNEKQPAVIVDTSSLAGQKFHRLGPRLFPLLDEVIRTNYVKAKVVGGCTLYARKDGPWAPVEFDRWKEFAGPSPASREKVWNTSFGR